jgi:hypothetical protein
MAKKTPHDRRGFLQAAAVVFAGVTTGLMNLWTIGEKVLGKLYAASVPLTITSVDAIAVAERHAVVVGVGADGRTDVMVV